MTHASTKLNAISDASLRGDSPRGAWKPARGVRAGQRGELAHRRTVHKNMALVVTADPDIRPVVRTRDNPFLPWVFSILPLRRLTAYRTAEGEIRFPGTESITT